MHQNRIISKSTKIPSNFSCITSKIASTNKHLQFLSHSVQTSNSLNSSISSKQSNCTLPKRRRDVLSLDSISQKYFSTFISPNAFIVTFNSTNSIFFIKHLDSIVNRQIETLFSKQIIHSVHSKLLNHSNVNYSTRNLVIKRQYSKNISSTKDLVDRQSLDNLDNQNNQNCQNGSTEKENITNKSTNNTTNIQNTFNNTQNNNTSNDNTSNDNTSQSNNTQDPPKSKWKKTADYFTIVGSIVLMASILIMVFNSQDSSSRNYNSNSNQNSVSNTNIKPLNEEQIARLKILSRGDIKLPETVKALAELGYLYASHGDKEQAIFYLRKASECDDLSSMFNLALLLLDEFSLDTIPNTNTTNIYSNINPNSNPSENNSKLLQKDKQGKHSIKSDHLSLDEAVKLLQKVSETGHSKGQLELGKALIRMARDFSFPLNKRRFSAQEAEKWLEESAKRGNIDAHFQLGNLYFFGIPDIVSINPEKAISNYKVAANENIPEAMFHYGMALKNGFGTTKDLDKGLDYLQKAAEKQNHMAIYEIGTLLFKGIPGKVPHDPVSAFQCFVDASKLGNRDASYMIAHCYVEGIGVERDMKKAFDILELLAPHDAHAKVSLGVCYAQGNGVEKNFEKAVQIWNEVLTDDSSYTRSSLTQFASIAEASFNLGVCYRNGFGVPQDIRQAKNLFADAAKYGHPQGKAALEELNQL